MERVAMGGGWMEDGGWVAQRQGWDKSVVWMGSTEARVG
jgi:hypothetical protein